MHPEYQDSAKAMLHWAPQLAAVLKLATGIWLANVLIRRRLMPARLMANLMAVWLLTAAVLTGLLCWLIPRNLAPWHLVAACVVLFLPLVRLSLSPLALAWNRHR